MNKNNIIQKVKYIKFFLFLFIFSLKPGLVSTVSYYDVISNELNYCKKNGGQVVGIENGDVTKNNGCPGCFCQFEDNSICDMEQLMKICDKGQYKTYYRGEEMKNLPELNKDNIYNNINYKHNFYKTFDDKLVDSTELEINYLKKIDNAIKDTAKNTLWSDIMKFIKLLFNSFLNLLF